MHCQCHPVHRIFAILYICMKKQQFKMRKKFNTKCHPNINSVNLNYCLNYAFLELINLKYFECNANGQKPEICLQQ